MAIGDFNPLPKISARADVAIAAFFFVKNTSAAQENLTCDLAGAGDKPMGIAADSGILGQNIPIASEGRGRLTVDGSGTAIVAGDYLKPADSESGLASDGYGVKAGTDKDIYGAIALDPSTAKGDIIRVEIVGGGAFANI